MKSILYFTELHVGPHITQLSGVYDRALARRWRVVEIERQRSQRSIAGHVARWRPDGCIMECSGDIREDLVAPFRKTPVVYIDPDPATARRARHTVSSDSESIAAAAAKELVRANRASYAFVGWCHPTLWSAERGAVFAAAVRKATGLAPAVYDKPWPIGDTRVFQTRLAAFLRKLPRPVGIFAVNDYTAVQAADACRLLDWSCPRDMSIVGVDNEEMHCECSDPTLTSIEQDFRGAGRLAADLLAELLENPSLGPRHLKYAPLRTVRRQSSRVFAVNDHLVAKAVERIRRDAATGIGAADVIAGMQVSRRHAEKRFLAATGRTILEEIQRVRLGMVCDLLLTDVPIGHIAARCGMLSDSYLKRFFKAQTGMTLREWRRRKLEVEN